MQPWTYFLLMLASIMFPVIFSFEKQIRFFNKWKYVIPAILLPGAFFIVWDIWFTKAGIWAFSYNYTLGPRLFGLPFEEWLFFIVIPFCGIFIYEVVKFYLKALQFEDRAFRWTFFLLIPFVSLAIIFFEKAYTFWNFTFNSIFLIFILLNGWFHRHLTHLLITFIISLIPMLIVNGILTSFPVVTYNPAELSNFRIYTIPFEDFFYFFLLLAMNIMVYEWVQHKKK